MGGVRDPFILAQIDSWLAQLDDNIKTRIRNTVGDRAYEIVTRVYGRDGVMGALEPQRRVIDGVGGHEAFILWDVISESQELSRTIATSLSHLAVHNPIPKWYRRARDAEIVIAPRSPAFTTATRPRSSSSTTTPRWRSK